MYDSNRELIKETKQYYDDRGFTGIGNRGDLTKVELWNNNGNNSFTYYSYDPYGNVETQTDALGNTNKVNYDAVHTYPVNTINALGHITFYNYDLATGNLNYVEKNGIRTNYYYDVFGRIIKEVQPYDALELPTKFYNYSFDGVAPEKITIKQRTTANNTEESSFFYDGFANIIQLKQRVYNQEIVKNIYYDGNFRVGSEQNPYFAPYEMILSNVSTSANKTAYVYDTISRIIRIVNPDGTNKTTIYERYNITDYDENSHKHMYTIDGRGRITNVYEYNIDPFVNVSEIYTTTYLYDNNDNLIRIIDNEGNNFNFYYDSLGRKIIMTDPDLGTWGYSYDNNGNLISQSGAFAGLINGDGYYREYNDYGQLIRLRNGSTATSQILEQYYYDQSGQRIKVVKNDTYNTTIYTPFDNFMMIKNSTGTFNFTYIYHEGALLARKNPDNSVQYYHDDHLGSINTDNKTSIIKST